jgi:ribosomal protein S12 methylthiotransferase accessory factor
MIAATFNWDKRFRFNVLSEDAAVVFSQDKIIVLQDASAEAAIELFFKKYLGVKGSASRNIQIERAGDRFARILQRHRVISKCARSAWRRQKPSSSSFIFVAHPLRSSSIRTRAALKKLLAGRNRVVYQLNGSWTEFAGRRITRFAAAGLALNADFTVPIFSSGAAKTLASAVTRFIGETIERHDCAAYTNEDLIFSSARARTEPIIDPSSIILYKERDYSRSGFPFSKFDPKRRFRWSYVYALDDGERRLIPAQFVYAPYFQRATEPRLWQATSSGVAAGTTRSDAIVRAILELVERDAAMLLWHRKRVDARITNWRDFLRGANQEWQGKCVNVYAMENAINCPCVLAAVGADGNEEPHIAFGTAADVSWAAAIERAIIDAVLCQQWLSEEGFQSVQRPQDIRRKQDHARLYGNKRYAEVFRFLRHAREGHGNSFKDLASSRSRERVLFLVSALKARGFRSWCKDLTSELARGLGHHVVRVIVPGLVPMQFADAPSPLGMVRLQGSVAMGAEAEPLPHPFG